MCDCLLNTQITQLLRARTPAKCCDVMPVFQGNTSEAKTAKKSSLLYLEATLGQPVEGQLMNIIHKHATLITRWGWPYSVRRGCLFPLLLLSVTFEQHVCQVVIACKPHLIHIYLLDGTVLNTFSPLAGLTYCRPLCNKIAITLLNNSEKVLRSKLNTNVNGDFLFWFRESES